MSVKSEMAQNLRLKMVMKIILWRMSIMLMGLRPSLSGLVASSFS